MNEQDMGLVLTAMMHLDHRPREKTLDHISSGILTARGPLDLDLDLPVDAPRQPPSSSTASTPPVSVSPATLISTGSAKPTGAVQGRPGSPHTTGVILSLLTAMAKRSNGAADGGLQAAFSGSPRLSLAQEDPVSRKPVPDPTDAALDPALDPVRVDALLSRLTPRLPLMTGARSLVPHTPTHAL